MGIGRVVIFEGPDGAGKTSLIDGFAGSEEKNTQFKVVSFPGKVPGSIGGLVYDIHHDKNVIKGSTLNPLTVQGLHLAAHYEQIFSQIQPAVNEGINVLVDRYWWSTYAYGRLSCDKEMAIALIECERLIWDRLFDPVIVYVDRKKSLKNELSDENYKKVRSFYEEIISFEEKRGQKIIRIENDGSIEKCLIEVKNKLKEELQ